MTDFQVDVLRAQLVRVCAARRAHRFFYAEAGPDGEPVLLLGARIDAIALISTMRSAQSPVFQSGKVKPLPGGQGLIFRVKQVTAPRFMPDLFGRLAVKLPLLAASAFLVDGEAPIGPGAIRMERAA